MELSEDVAKLTEVWVSPDGFIYLAIPRNAEATWYSMYSGEEFLPTAYAKSVWERLGWEYLGKFWNTEVEDKMREVVGLL